LINIILDVINYILVAILIGVSATWIALIKSMLRTFNESPFLDKFEKKEHMKPKQNTSPKTSPKASARRRKAD